MTERVADAMAVGFARGVGLPSETVSDIPAVSSLLVHSRVLERTVERVAALVPSDQVTTVSEDGKTYNGEGPLQWDF